MVIRVGFVGLGNIGKPMALRLAHQARDAGRLSVSVYDVMSEPVAELGREGADAAASVAELAARVDVLCVMVRDDDQVRDVLGQALGSARDGLVIVVHSTVAPETPRQLEVTAAKHGVLLVDAPVSGGAMGAADGSLAIMVGGSEEAYSAARPALEAMGSKVIHAGPIGAGTKFKLARNLMHFVSFTAATEAQRLAEAAGLDLRALGDVVRHTDAITGGPGAIMHRETAATIGPDDFWRGIFTHLADLGEKDLRFATELAESLGVDTPLADLAMQRLRTGLGL
ncbi:MAG: NAD(P)-dependent oxidoreductase [Nocardioides sp.]